MRSIINKFIFAAILGTAVSVWAVLFPVYAKEVSKKELPNVIVVTLSGVRNIESIAEPHHQYMPHLWESMLKEGTLYNNLVNLNHEFHMPVVHAINTGITYTAYYSQLKKPSLFQYLIKQYNLAADQAWSVGHWYPTDCANKTEGYQEDTFPAMLSFISFNVPPELFETLTPQEKKFCLFFSDLVAKSPGWPSWDSIGVIQYRFFKKIIDKFHPKLVHYVMNDVESAHSDMFSRYAIALHTSDKNIFEIWSLIQTDQFYKDNTYLIVNVDHERNTYYADHNENSYDNPSRVWMYIFGPGVKKGAIIDRRIEHVDIFATVAGLMFLEKASTEGRFLSDCFSSQELQEKIRIPSGF